MISSTEGTVVDTGNCEENRTNRRANRSLQGGDTLSISSRYSFPLSFIARAVEGCP